MSRAMAGALLAAVEGQGVLPGPMLDAIQRAADLLAEVGWVVQSRRAVGLTPE